MNYSFKQSGFTWPVILLILAVAGLILWIFMSTRDALKETSTDIQNGAIGNTVGSNAAKTVTSFFGGIFGPIVDGVKNIYNKVTGSPATDSKGTGAQPTQTQSSNSLADTVMNPSEDQTEA